MTVPNPFLIDTLNMQLAEARYHLDSDETREEDRHLVAEDVSYLEDGLS